MHLELLSFLLHIHSIPEQRTVKFFIGGSEVKMREQDQRDERPPLLQAALAGTEPPSVISVGALQCLPESKLSQADSSFSSMVEEKLQYFKRELSEDNASSLE